MPGGVGSARPMLLKVPKGPLLLTGGRPHLMLWVSADGMGSSWEAINLAGEHNKRVAPGEGFRFCDAFANGTSTWLESTCYNSLQLVSPDAGPGTGEAWSAIVCYDNLATQGPAAPTRCIDHCGGVPCVRTHCIATDASDERSRAATGS